MELCIKIKEHINDFHIFESEIAEDPDKRDYIVSNEKIESTGWFPKFSIDDGMSIHLTRDRVSKGSYNVVYSEDINEIPVRGVEIYKISMNGQNPNIVFLPARV